MRIPFEAVWIIGCLSAALVKWVLDLRRSSRYVDLGRVNDT
jgi:hypothetical protein